MKPINSLNSLTPQTHESVIFREAFFQQVMEIIDSNAFCCSWCGEEIQLDFPKENELIPCASCANTNIYKNNYIELYEGIIDQTILSKIMGGEKCYMSEL